MTLDNKGGAVKQLFGGFKSYLWLLLGLCSLYFILSPHVTLTGESGVLNPASAPYDGDPRVMFVTALFLLAGLAAVLTGAYTGKMTAGKLCAYLVAAGFILRFGYMLYTPFYIRGHDVGSHGGYGHLDYIYRLFTGKGLPMAVSGQFYHPPLSHIAGAAAARIDALIFGPRELDATFQAAKLVPCFASCALVILCRRIFDALEFSNTAKTAALAVIAFHPTFVILSASINNDTLMVFFFMSAFLYAIRWYKDPTYKNILLTAVFIGCAMSTKFSGALIAVFTAMIFLAVLIRRISEGKSSALIGQFAAFATLCFPLGLWYHLRNLTLFGQKLGYVAEIPVTSSLFVGDVPFAERFISFSLPDMLQKVYCDPFSDYRLWEYTVKCALFGEYVFSPGHDAVARILIVVSLILIVLSLLAMVLFLFIDRKRNRLAVLSLFFIWALSMASFIYFNIRYPFGCTMDFRYIVPTVITGAAFLGLLYDRLRAGRYKKLTSAVFIAVLAVFCAASAAFYLV